MDFTYAIVDDASGLLEGYYVDFKDAKDRYTKLKRRFKNRSFTIDLVEDGRPLANEDMMKFSDWYDRKKNA